MLKFFVGFGRYEGTVVAMRWAPKGAEEGAAEGPAPGQPISAATVAAAPQPAPSVAPAEAPGAPTEAQGTGGGEGMERLWLVNFDDGDAEECVAAPARCSL